jgi:hypothetical protein
MTTERRTVYLCPTCGGYVTEAPLTAGFGFCPRMEKVAYVNGERRIVKAGCRQNPPLWLGNLESRIIDVEIPDAVEIVEERG